MTVAEVIEHSRGGVSVNDEIKVIDEPDEVRAARAKAEKDRLAYVSTSYTSNSSAAAIPDNHDTYFPNVADLSLKWATSVRELAKDMLKHPGPGTIYAHYGDKNSSSLADLIGWLDDHIAKLSAEPPKP